METGSGFDVTVSDTAVAAVAGAVGPATSPAISTAAEPARTIQRMLQPAGWSRRGQLYCLSKVFMISPPGPAVRRSITHPASDGPRE